MWHELTPRHLKGFYLVVKIVTQEWKEKNKEKKKIIILFLIFFFIFYIICDNHPQSLALNYVFISSFYFIYSILRIIFYSDLLLSRCSNKQLQDCTYLTLMSMRNFSSNSISFLYSQLDVPHFFFFILNYLLSRKLWIWWKEKIIKEKKQKVK